MNRRLDRYTTAMLGGAPRPRPRNHLAEALRCFRAYFQWRKRFARLNPGFFDYAARDRQILEEAARRELEAELNAALDKVYGPSPPGQDAGKATAPPIHSFPSRAFGKTKTEHFKK